MRRIVLDGHLEQMRGVIGRYPDDDEEYVFTYDDVARRGVHMLFVGRPLEVSWYAGDELRHRETLQPWFGFGFHAADRIVEKRP